MSVHATTVISRCLMVGLLAGLLPAATFGQSAGDPCDEYLLPQRDTQGGKVGPESCRKIETDFRLENRSLRRFDIGLSGTTDGYVTRGGDYSEYLTSAPDLVFPQTSDLSRTFHTVARYEREKGAAMTVVFPANRSDWNGKMWVMVHGRGRSFQSGNLKAWNGNLDPADAAANLNKYDRVILRKGYALVKTYRTSAEGLGEIQATLENELNVDDVAFNDTHQYIKDFVAVAEAVVAKQLGEAPRRTYLYGHSAGGRLGRGFNYTPGLNVDAEGKPFIDGILADDSASGTWLPVVMKSGVDVLLQTDADRAAFVPQIDVTHQMYNNIWRPQRAAWVSNSFLENKRRNARILRDKGMTPKHRMYEIRSISHSGGESLPDGRRGDVQILDLSLMMGQFIDMLDNWVEKGEAPPPMRSDWAELGDADKDGTIENPGISFPEVACPLGIYYAFPVSSGGRGIGSTSFAPFTGEGLEPLDGREVFVDMNRNGVWDLVETPSQAWQRLGLLAEGEELTRDRYVACVREAAESLRRDGFFSEETAQMYIERAQTADISPESVAPGEPEMILDQ